MLDLEPDGRLLDNVSVGRVFRDPNVHGGMGDEVVVVASAGETDTGCELTLRFAQQSLRGDLEELSVALPVSPMRQCQCILVII